MSQITATVSSQPIAATVSGSGVIAASVGSSTFTATASGGIGPQGPQGVSGGGGGAATTDASLLSSGTLAQARLDFIPIHPFLLMGG
jgi:hypothetical protein